MGKKDRSDNGKRVTVILEKELWLKVKREVKKRQEQAKYQVTVAQVVRELVATLP